MKGKHAQKNFGAVGAMAPTLLSLKTQGGGGINSCPPFFLNVHSTTRYVLQQPNIHIYTLTFVSLCISLTVYTKAILP